MASPVSRLLTQSDSRTVHDWIAEHPRPLTQTLAGVSRRVVSGEPFRPAVFELLDQLDLPQTDSDRIRAIKEEPTPTGNPKVDTLLAALGEWTALKAALEVPVWTEAPDRFLDRFWFLSNTAGFRALAIAQSPAAFRRRGIFIAEGFLDRC